MSEELGKKVYHKVIDYISDQVDKGILKKGDKIPTERRLVEILGVSRNSIREALKILDIIGLVERKQGIGTYIKTEFNNGFSEPMSVAFMLSDTSDNDIFEFRNMIEVEIATLAAERITDEEIVQLKECFLMFMNAENERDSVRFDRKFHSLIAKASKNLIIINSYNAMSLMLDSFILNIRSEAFKMEDPDLAYEIHKDVHDAIINKDPKGAKEAMIRHMDVINNNYYKLR